MESGIDESDASGPWSQHSTKRILMRRTYAKRRNGGRDVQDASERARSE